MLFFYARYDEAGADDPSAAAAAAVAFAAASKSRACAWQGEKETSRGTGIRHKAMLSGRRLTHRLLKNVATMTSPDLITRNRYTTSSSNFALSYIILPFVNAPLMPHGFPKFTEPDRPPPFITTFVQPRRGPKLYRVITTEYRRVLCAREGHSGVQHDGPLRGGSVPLRCFRWRRAPRG